MIKLLLLAKDNSALQLEVKIIDLITLKAMRKRKGDDFFNSGTTIKKQEVRMRLEIRL
jgi:hypothetical protein